MSSSSSYRQSLPLPPNFFTCPPLREDEIKHMKHLAVTIATEVVEHSQLRDGGVAWTLRADEGNMRFFKAPDPLHRVGAHMFMSVVEVAGTLDEVIDLFRTDTTFKAKEYVKRFGKGLLDAVNLYTIVDPTPDFPNEKIAVTWFAMKSPFDKIVANRDCVMLECQHEFEWTAGRRAWVRGLQSVALPCCPDMQSTLGLVRSTQYGVGHVVLESLDRPGYLQISFLNHFDVKGTPPEWLIELGMKKRCKSILDIELYLREDRLGRGVVLSPADFVPLTRRRHCFLCRKRFRPWTKRSNCMKCGEVLCRGCNPSWNVKLHHGTVHSIIQACIRCAQGQQHPDNVLHGDAIHGTTTTHSHASSSSNGKIVEPRRIHAPSYILNDEYDYAAGRAKYRGSPSSVASTSSVWTTSSGVTKRQMGRRFLSTSCVAPASPQHQPFLSTNHLVLHDVTDDDVASRKQTSSRSRTSSTSDDGGSCSEAVWLTLSQGRGGEFVVHSPASMGGDQQTNHNIDRHPVSYIEGTHLHHHHHAKMITAPLLLPSTSTKQHGHQRVLNPHHPATTSDGRAAAAAWTTPSAITLRPSIDSTASDDLHMLTTQWTIDRTRYRHRSSFDHDTLDKTQARHDTSRTTSQPTRDSSLHGPIYLE
ncbi:hypothetical protein H257_08918 [Aphanomyces astaci]|uniref:FYVE-type domain-containing protein n=1 Tax=Aphanomyces astaci TaxID=112090 RepID=W4GCJ0_APHAT|nr:hypothetical protein H257_08918 [Aphanomyces astaci]ETV77001.1 hypothetical protein H257_08918 [Aphanomyces astaci]|eukprot:XP_009833307.1 hypothetical protein H257_08918 [Aphanomyces astaci]